MASDLTPREKADEHEDATRHTVIRDVSYYLCLDCVWTSTGQDKRLDERALCRATTTLGQHEFICPNPQHDQSPKRALQHYFVRRYPFGNH